MIFNNKLESDANAAKIKLIIADNDGTLTPGHTFYSKEGEELKMYSHRDGRGVHLLKKAGIKFGIITGEKSQIVLKRAEKLKVDFVALGVDDKTLELPKVLMKYKLKSHQVAYIGDDTNDLGIMDLVGLSVAVNDAHIDVLNKADIICTNKGGNGALREIIDYILSISISK
jgi:3-deoxy-D-manno-octulosonate 8-phosphate phosphatase (KDO 8-P phosphatase)